MPRISGPASDNQPEPFEPFPKSELKLPYDQKRDLWDRTEEILAEEKLKFGDPRELLKSALRGPISQELATPAEASRWPGQPLSIRLVLALAAEPPRITGPVQEVTATLNGVTIRTAGGPTRTARFKPEIASHLAPESPLRRTMDVISIESSALAKAAFERLQIHPTIATVVRPGELIEVASGLLLTPPMIETLAAHCAAPLTPAAVDGRGGVLFTRAGLLLVASDSRSYTFVPFSAKFAEALESDLDEARRLKMIWTAREHDATRDARELLQSTLRAIIAEALNENPLDEAGGEERKVIELQTRFKLMLQGSSDAPLLSSAPLNLTRHGLTQKQLETIETFLEFGEHTVTRKLESVQRVSTPIHLRGKSAYEMADLHLAELNRVLKQFTNPHIPGRHGARETDRPLRWFVHGGTLAVLEHHTEQATAEIFLHLTRSLHLTLADELKKEFLTLVPAKLRDVSPIARVFKQESVQFSSEMFSYVFAKWSLELQTAIHTGRPPELSPAAETFLCKIYGLPRSPWVKRELTSELDELRMPDIPDEERPG